MNLPVVIIQALAIAMGGHKKTGQPSWNVLTTINQYPCMIWESRSYVVAVVFKTSTLLCFKIMPRSSSATLSDIRQCSVAQLAYLPAEVLCLYCIVQNFDGGKV